MEPVGDPPAYVKKTLRLIRCAPHQKISDSDLRGMGIEPSTMRRWFKNNHGMTFQAYQRMLRINLGYQQIKTKTSVTHGAFDTGFKSMSGFAESYKNLFGASPSKSEEINTIIIERFSTPLGAMFACATNEGICLLEFTNRRMLEAEFKDLRKRLKAVIVPGENQHIRCLKKEMQAYFSGQLRHFSVPLVTPGTDFQNKVWKSLQKVPYGKTKSYLEQAQAMGNEKAVRAVARANGMNRIAIVIPCHRIIGSDGSLTGYAGGLPRKKWLLEFESKQLSI